MRLLILALTVVALAVSCVDTRTSATGDDVDARAQPIINGEVDTTHQAVVAVLGNDRLCSGTIVQTDPQNEIGWVLTAATFYSE